MDARESSVKFAFHAVETSVGFINGLSQSAGGWLAAAGVLRCQVLPEKRVVDVAAAVEVDQRLKSDLRGNVLACIGGRHLLRRVVVGVHVGVVMLRVVQLHDLARDCGFEGAIVVCGEAMVSYCPEGFLGDMGPDFSHERSGRVALPRTKMVGAKAALLPLFKMVLPKADLTNEVAIFVEITVLVVSWRVDGWNL